MPLGRQFTRRIGCWEDRQRLIVGALFDLGMSVQAAVSIVASLRGLYLTKVRCAHLVKAESRHLRILSQYRPVALNRILNRVLFTVNGGGHSSHRPRDHNVLILPCIDRDHIGQRPLLESVLRSCKLVHPLRFTGRHQCSLSTDDG